MDFQTALNNWLTKAQKLVTDHELKSFPKLVEIGGGTTLSIDPGGKKFIRIVASQYNGKSRSAFAFIDIATGDVLKPDGWKRPAKGARGNIYTENLGIGAYGALYAR